MTEEHATPMPKRWTVIVGAIPALSVVALAAAFDSQRSEAQVTAL